MESLKGSVLNRIMIREIKSGSGYGFMLPLVNCLYLSVRESVINKPPYLRQLITFGAINCLHPAINCLSISIDTIDGYRAVIPSECSKNLTKSEQLIDCFPLFPV
jgi:hypothetical protein